MSFTPDSMRMPFLEMLRSRAEQPDAPFYAPGHKRGRGISPELANWWGEAVFAADLPELPELDNLFAPEGVIEEAQTLAAKTFGAERTWFLANGSTCGIIAAILATCGPGDKIILPRNVHQSAIAGLILSGATPIFIAPEYDPALDLVLNITPEAVEAALKENSDVKAVLVVYPTYQGICCDLHAIAKLAHHHHIPLIADEAHGAHFAFHPDLPPSALAAGADISIQSTHKVLGAMSQASMLHLHSPPTGLCCKARIDAPRLSLALQLVQSSSPSYLLLASLDAARQQMAITGRALMEKTLALSDRAYREISQIPGLSVLESPASPQPGFFNRDATRLTVFTAALGLDGFTADEILRQQFHVTAELPLPQHLTFILSLGNDESDIEALIHAFGELARNPREGAMLAPLPVPSAPASAVMTPRKAFFAPRETLPLEDAAGRISAELICPYPPGIPVLLPGEIVTKDAIDFLQQILALGGCITGCSDSTLKTIQVIQE
ncbi:aminotransferase class I/II-fold pyridoxal phosphate-dependent enzyme [Oscillatoria sp. FACHB-1406]|uniref:aminotransferase class I/II-fold pyridoxal phosphate-dependent enzyme n=1 Tax=Oscillatoria sp. FACHB-1406 TaxID=2692846 RepID=UPI0016825D4D|nr:aminotransferase class I/II-fold pyridoxal phosphate-dependent enzyme [Oscillatoria sp. FACHB-1406]MBD2576559.1 aminotransferase class I/II-fold pyridoxal phosphate-dependent enzyme [Oscillatoria sp. FACHB-1406]